MDESYVEAEISAQSDLLKKIPINKAVVSRIDAHIKSTEAHLNEELIFLPASLVTQDFRPRTGKKVGFATKVDEEVWNNLYFAKNWYDEESFHEELSFERDSKGLAFFYSSGTVEFDLGVCEDLDGTDWYYKIKKDSRKKYRVVGAPVELKLKFFQNLYKLLDQIFRQAAEFKTDEMMKARGGYGDGNGRGDGSGYGYGDGYGNGRGDGSGFGEGNS